VTPAGAPGAAAASARSGGSGGGSAAEMLAGLREILTRVIGRDQAAALAPDTPLFRDGAGLDSLTGTLLLMEVRRQFGVDVAAEDLNLASLASLATLAAFIAEHRPPT
jgi:acyl carrier protein